MFELPLRMNGMRRTQSDPLGLGTLQGKKRQDTGNKWTIVIYFKSVLFCVLAVLSYVANAKIGRVVYLTDKCQ